MTNQNNNTIDSLIQVQSYLNELWKGGLPWTANTIKVVNNDDIEMINYVYMSIIKISIMTKIMMIMMIKKMIKIMMPRWCLSSLQCSSVPRYGSSSHSPLTSGCERICRNMLSYSSSPSGQTKCRSSSSFAVVSATCTFCSC